MYLPSRLRVGIGAEAIIKALKMVEVGVGVLLLLVRAPLANLSLPVRRIRLEQVCKPAIWLAG